MPGNQEEAMRWLAMLITALFVTYAQAGELPVGSTEPFIDVMICKEFDHSFDLVEAYKKSDEIGDQLFELYSERRRSGPPRCVRISFNGTIITRPYSEHWVDKRGKKVEINIFHVYQTVKGKDYDGYAIVDEDVDKEPVPEGAPL